MLSEPPATKPRRNWHLLRWAFLLIALSTGWGAWKEHDFQQAVKEAGELGWEFEYTDPIAIIRENWRNAFRKETWEVTDHELAISIVDQSEGHFNLIRRLAVKQLVIASTGLLRQLPECDSLSNLPVLKLGGCPNLTNIDALKDMKGLIWLEIHDAIDLMNIDGLKELKHLKRLALFRCRALTNVDALRNHNTLKTLDIIGCDELKNVDGLLKLTKLETLDLFGCTGLTNESMTALKAALPKTYIRTPKSMVHTLGGK